jgi:DNA-binding NarL/FixJ family response regulator
VTFGLKILAVDDEPLVLTLLSETLKAQGYEVTTATDAASAKRACTNFDPDLAILDVDLGSGPDGFDLATSLRHASPTLAIIFLTNVAEPRLAGKSVKNLPAGYGYLLKSKLGDSKLLNAAIVGVARGAGKEFRENIDSGHALGKLSRSQLQVVQLLAMGKSNEEIAQIRNTTIRAVRLILVRAFKVMGISEQGGPERRVQAAIQYLKATGFPR